MHLSMLISDLLFDQHATTLYTRALSEVDAATTLLSSPDALTAFEHASQPEQETRADLLFKLQQAQEQCMMRCDALANGNSPGKEPSKEPSQQLSEQDAAAELIYSVKGKLDTFLVRYCLVPDVWSVHRCFVCLCFSSSRVCHLLVL
jgi:hypothetical protein